MKKRAAPKKRPSAKKASPSKKAAPKKKAAPGKKAAPKKKATPKKKAAPRTKATAKKKASPKKKAAAAAPKKPKKKAAPKAKSTSRAKAPAKTSTRKTAISKTATKKSAGKATKASGKGTANKAKRPAPKRPPSLRSAEVREVARDLTLLALLRQEKDGPLNVRLRESLRRTLAEAGETLGWAEMVVSTKDPVTAVSKDVKKMVKSGAQSLSKEVAEELAFKKTEEKQLENVVEAAHKLANDPKVQFPTEITYSHTARETGHGLVTRTETVTVADAKEALEAAESITKSMAKWAKLRDEMQEELKLKQKRLGSINQDLPAFVESWRGLLKEVIVTLA